jgi:hypothetical protein
MSILKTGALYFLVVFAAGFVLGPIRILWVVPRLGARAAELIEAPIMLAVIVLAARWVVRRAPVPTPLTRWLGAGFFALAVMVTVEFTVVLTLRGLSFREYLERRDPVSGAVYVLLLGFFAVAPFLVAWTRRRGN